MIRTMGVYLEKMYSRPLYRIALIILGIFSIPFVLIKYFSNKKENSYEQIKKDVADKLIEDGVKDKIAREIEEQLKNKQKFFKKQFSDEDLKKQKDKIANKKFNETAANLVEVKIKKIGIKNVTFISTFANMFSNKAFLAVSIIISFPMYVLILIYSNPYSKYIFERLIMMIFVIFGVTWLVFTILYLSPMDPAINVLGQTATPEQVAQFNKISGLDKPYYIQLVDTFKNLITFNLGKSYVGNEDVLAAILRKFPITLQLTFASLIISVVIAIPAGIISAIKQYSSFDYIFMLVALLGLSIPTFWMGLILILNFSINTHLLPATFIVGNWKTLIMPSIVLGTSLAATVARMTRSSMLEIKNMDYIVTARAKGLSERKVITKHILGNAMIPIVTVIGLQFGGMLGGSAVTEKVFNINGIGSFIVDKQFIPDIPIVLAGVVYVAVIISLANLVVDIMYSFLDPRIKSKMKSY